MKRFFVIEADTEMYNVFVYEATREFGKDVVTYSHAPDAQIMVMDPLSPKFYGRLDLLLVNRRKIEDAAITPVHDEVKL